MEGLVLNLIPLSSFMILFIVEFIFFRVINRFGGIQKFLLKYQYFIESQLGLFHHSNEVAKNQQECEFTKKSVCSSIEKRDDEVIRRGDMEVVLERLGLFCTPKDEKLKGSLCSNEISNLFEEREPSLEELKGAFDVFDQNKDGFIDADELNRVMSILGLKEGLDIENCSMMISTFDKNGDNKIDFNEFVKVMETGFC